MGSEVSAQNAVSAGHKNRPDSSLGLLLVVLGEFVWRKQEAAWASAIVAALFELGASENAARKAIQRAAERGLIETRRLGRQAQCTITGAGRQLFREGAERVFGFRGESPNWDGRWLVTTITIPESQRNLRHHLRTRFTLAGLGSPSPGVWITPHVGAAIKPIIKDLGLEDDTCSFIGPFGPAGFEEAMVRAAWDIGGLEQRYEEFIARFKTARPQSHRDVFCAYVNMLQAWRQFPYTDPMLPARFLPRPWIGVRAVNLMHEKRELWSVSAAAFWSELQAQA